MTNSTTGIQISSIDDGQAAASRSARQSDGASEILPSMAHYTAFVLKCKRPSVLNRLHAYCGAEVEVSDGAFKNSLLPIAKRRNLFEQIATASAEVHSRLEQVCERVHLLDDPLGGQAIESMLVAPGDQDVIASPTNRRTKAMHLYLEQEAPLQGAQADSRFDHAERTQAMYRQWRNHAHATHYLLAGGAQIQFNEHVEENLRQRIAQAFPAISAQQILIDHFTRTDARNRVQHTVCATFNGTVATYSQVANGEVIDFEEPAAMTVDYAWDSHSQTLSVFCDDREARVSLAEAFRDEVLAGEVQFKSMPLLEFDVSQFADARVLDRLSHERIAGIERITIQRVRLACQRQQEVLDDVGEVAAYRNVTSYSTWEREDWDQRHIYEVGKQDWAAKDLSAYSVDQVGLSFRFTARPGRKAHKAGVQIRFPAGFSQSLTQDDRQLVLDQLRALGVVSMH